MEDSNDKAHTNVQLEVTFPKSDEDHRLQLVEINGSIFAIVYAPLTSNGPIALYCEEWSLILLAPIKSKVDVVISGINVICFNDIESEEGSVSITASNQLVTLAPSIKPSEKVHITGDQGEFRFDNDPAAFLTHFQLFNKVVKGAENEESFLEARQRFIAGLCGLAQKMDGKTADLTIERVLGIWDIPCSKP